MADNLTTTTTVATIPNNTRIATRAVTYSGDASSHIAPVGIVAFSGSDDAKSATDIPGDADNGLDVDVTRVQGTVTVELGGVAETTRPAAVADGDAVRAWFDELGRQIVQIGSGEENFVAAEYTSNQTDATLISAPGAGLFIRIFDILVSTGTAGTVLFEEGTTTRLFGRISLAANGGWSFNSAKGVRLSAANTALTITTTTGAGPLAVTVNYSIEP